MTKEDVEFKALDGTVLRAWLFRPEEGPSKFPAITMAHGFSVTKWHGLERAAEAFAEAGFGVLSQDHRGCGNSDGNPRQDIDPWSQIDDWRLAMTRGFRSHDGWKGAFSDGFGHEKRCRGECWVKSAIAFNDGEEERKMRWEI